MRPKLAAAVAAHESVLRNELKTLRSKLAERDAQIAALKSKLTESIKAEKNAKKVSI